MNSRITRVPVVMFAGGLALALPGWSWAQSPQGAAQSQAHRKSPNQVPDKGKDDPAPDAAPTAADAELERMLARPTEGLQATQRADGAISVSLDGGFMEVAIATVDEKGKVKFDCTNDHTRALRLLRSSVTRPSRPLGTAAAPAPTLEEKE